MFFCRGIRWLIGSLVDLDEKMMKKDITKLKYVLIAYSQKYPHEQISLGILYTNILALINESVAGQLSLWRSLPAH